MRLENSFVRNSFKGKKFLKKLFAVVSQVVHLSKKIRVVILKIKGRKNLKFLNFIFEMKNQNSLPDLQKKKKKIKK